MSFRIVSINIYFLHLVGRARSERRRVTDAVKMINDRIGSDAAA